jgi:rRNA maturation endonuclease Nob1
LAVAGTIPLGRRWNNAKDLLPDFEDRFSSIFSDMLCCAICGSTKLINKPSMTYINIRALNVFGNVPSCTRYGIANYFMAKYTTNATGTFMNICSKCKTSHNPNDYCPYIMTMIPKYLSNILRLNQLRVQMLSFLNISILLEDHQYGFVSGQISDTSLLNSPMLCGDNAINDETFFEGLVDDLQPLLEKNLSENPWFSFYLTNFKKTNDRSTSMCVLSAEVVQSIIEKRSVVTRPMDDEDTNAIIESLSLLLNVGEKEPTNHNKDYFFVGNLITRINLKTEQLHVRPYQLRTALGPNIT